jgi:hypothetical protein
MRRWTRATSAYVRTCGSCGTVIPAGDPLQEWTLPGVRRTRIRCRACAVGPVPPDLPPLCPEPAWAPLVPIPVGAHVLPFDYKARAAGDRDPGEEG